MKRNKKVIIVLLSILIISILILSTILILNKNINIIKLNESKEQLTTEDGVISTTDHLAQMQETQTELTNTQNTLTNTQTELSNFKSKISSAITSRGVSTSATATADTMANNIKNIPKGIERVTFKITCGAMTNNPFIGLDTMDISGFTNMTIKFYSGWGTPTFQISLDGTLIYNNSTSTTITRNITNNSKLQMRIQGPADNVLGVYEVTLTK